MIFCDYNLHSNRPVVSGMAQCKLPIDFFSLAFPYLEKDDLAKCRLVCRSWNNLLSNPDYREKHKLKENYKAFCFFNLSRIPNYLSRKHNISSAIVKRRIWNLTMQPETVFYIAEICAGILVWKNFKKMNAEMYAPSMDELRGKLAYFIGPNASNERIMSYLKGESIALGFLMLLIPQSFLATLGLATTGSLRGKYEYETKSAKKAVKKEFQESLLLPEKYSHVDELKPYVDPNTKRVWHIPVEFDGKVYELSSLFNPRTLEFSSSSNFIKYKYGLKKLIFRKDLYEAIQKIIKRIDNPMPLVRCS